jgi:alpha-galactosidase
VYFGLWVLAKSPLLLSADLAALPASIVQIISNPEVVAVNQDAAGVQARKLTVDGAPLPWLVGFERCDDAVGGGMCVCVCVCVCV